MLNLLLLLSNLKKTLIPVKELSIWEVATSETKKGLYTELGNVFMTVVFWLDRAKLQSCMNLRSTITSIMEEKQWTGSNHKIPKQY